eukprot:scaffold179324_cov33-Tisochrysis_lutea.AAC.5
MHNAQERSGCVTAFVNESVCMKSWHHSMRTRPVRMSSPSSAQQFPPHPPMQRVGQVLSRSDPRRATAWRLCDPTAKNFAWELYPCPLPRRLGAWCSVARQRGMDAKADVIPSSSDALLVATAPRKSLSHA